MTQQPTCTATLRAETGPCETCGSESRISIQHRGRVRPPNEDVNHPYLGPLLGVCGHEAGEHEPPREGRERPDGSPEPWHCGGCCTFAIRFQAKEQPCFHAFQPAADEPAGA